MSHAVCPNRLGRCSAAPLTPAPAFYPNRRHRLNHTSSAAAGLGEKRSVHRYASSGAEWGDKDAADPARCTLHNGGAALLISEL